MGYQGLSGKVATATAGPAVPGRASAERLVAAGGAVLPTDLDPPGAQAPADTLIAHGGGRPRAGQPGAISATVEGEFRKLELVAVTATAAVVVKL